tara:strand:- start:376 stop:552 length:177 start_codon:yes stop_codon:yes gene_type:complete
MVLRLQTPEDSVKRQIFAPNELGAVQNGGEKAQKCAKKRQKPLANRSDEVINANKSHY